METKKHLSNVELAALYAHPQGRSHGPCEHCDRGIPHTPKSCSNGRGRGTPGVAYSHGDYTPRGGIYIR